MRDEIIFPALREREDIDDIRERLSYVGEIVRDYALAELRRQPTASLSAITHVSPSDKIYAIDSAIEDTLISTLESELAPAISFALICEGINNEEPLTFPREYPVEECAARLIIDPIDGTRPIMYNKRSAWWLAGLAPNRGEATSLKDIEVAVQVEIPTTRALFADTLWAIRGGGAHGETVNLLNAHRTVYTPRPSTFPGIDGGFASFFHPFPGGRDILATIGEELFVSILGGLEANRSAVFDDQYLSTGGQLHELMTGRDRLLVDIRGLLFDRFRREGRPPGHACHPYDLAASLVAEEAGVILTNGQGLELNAPLNTTSDVSWIGYANQAIRNQVEERLLGILADHLLI
ncbi:MAG: hypothetical protein EBZ36_05780 [Acidobacteria bacterium]|nr:hypothetical protein [Acidobacteriota bacterium]